MSEKNAETVYETPLALRAAMRMRAHIALREYRNRGMGGEHFVEIVQAALESAVRDNINAQLAARWRVGDTPVTDAAAVRNPDGEWVAAHVARGLEQERNALLADLRQCESQLLQAREDSHG